MAMMNHGLVDIIGTTFHSLLLRNTHIIKIHTFISEQFTVEIYLMYVHIYTLMITENVETNNSKLTL